MSYHNEAMRLADEVRVVADRLQYTPGGFYGVETVGPLNQAAALLRQLSAERDQLRAEVGRLRARTLQAPWRHLDLDAVSDAFRDVIEAHHAQKNPFHNPLNHRAVIALRELKTIIPYMKALAQN